MSRFMTNTHIGELCIIFSTRLYGDDVSIALRMLALWK